MPTCAFCGKELEIEGKVYRSNTCEHCGNDLHCCVHCKFYEPGRQNDCREPQAENVQVKDRSNFCEYFEFTNEIRKVDEEDSNKKKLDDLFNL